MSLAQARVDTPLGAVRQAATDEGLTGLWFRGQQHESPSLVASVDAASHPVLAAEACELSAYFALDIEQEGPRRAPVALHGTQRDAL
jgi:hypothetical protein